MVLFPGCNKTHGSTKMVLDSWLNCYLTLIFSTFHQKMYSFVKVRSTLFVAQKTSKYCLKYLRVQCTKRHVHQHEWALLRYFKQLLFPLFSFIKIFHKCLSKIPNKCTQNQRKGREIVAQAHLTGAEWFVCGPLSFRWWGKQQAVMGEGKRHTGMTSFWLRFRRAG